MATKAEIETDVRAAFGPDADGGVEIDGRLWGPWEVAVWHYGPGRQGVLWTSATTAEPGSAAYRQGVAQRLAALWGSRLTTEDGRGGDEAVDALARGDGVVVS